MKIELSILKKLSELHVPTYYGMFNSRGEQRLAGYGRTMVKAAIKNPENARKLVVAYVVKRAMTARHPNHREAHDTYVREAVMHFANEVLAIFGHEWDESMHQDAKALEAKLVEKNVKKEQATGMERLRQLDAERNAKLEAEAEQDAREDIAAEQQFEMLAEFGPGVDLTNVLTGEKFRT